MLLPRQGPPPTLAGGASSLAPGARNRARAASTVVLTAVPESPEIDLAIVFLADARGVASRPLRTAQAPPRGSLRLIGFGATDRAGRKGVGIKRAGHVLVAGWNCSAAT